MMFTKRKILEEKLETVKAKVWHKTVDYNVVPLNGSDYGVVDIRDFRKSCDDGESFCDNEEAVHMRVKDLFD